MASESDINETRVKTGAGVFYSRKAVFSVPFRFFIYSIQRKFIKKRKEEKKRGRDFDITCCRHFGNTPRVNIRFVYIFVVGFKGEKKKKKLRKNHSFCRGKKSKKKWKRGLVGRYKGVATRQVVLVGGKLVRVGVCHIYVQLLRNS